MTYDEKLTYLFHLYFYGFKSRSAPGSMDEANKIVRAIVWC